MTKDWRRVVVTGMGAITPIGHDVATTWDNMVAGKHGIAPITHFDTEGWKSKVAAEVKDFAPTQYMSKSETLRTDRFAQFALVSAAQAVEDSGIVGTLPEDRVAVYYGSGIGGIQTMETEHTKLLQRGHSRVSPLFVPMMISNMAAGLIAIKYGFRGPAMPAVTACATGSNAIGEAMRLIRHGYADAVVTGGCEASITPVGVAGFVNMQALSTSDNPDAASMPFDRRRGGFVIGEGGAALVLEEYEHAKARGAKIYAELCGYGSTCDANHITAPREDGSGGAAAMVQAMTEAGYQPGEKVYINAHGTGTPLNDVIETRAIKSAMGEAEAYKAYVSSTKSVTGHMMGAAGAIEAIACIMALQTGVLPPTANLLEQDEACDLNCLPLKAENVQVDLCVSNSLGFGGHNACLAFRKGS